MRQVLLATGAALLALAACGRGSETPAATEAPSPAPSGNAASEVTPKARPPLDYRALSGYDDSWFLSGGWPGEYPPGFAVLDANVRVPARARPTPSDPQDISCLLPQYANYQLWNTSRSEADQLEFFTATRKFPVTFTSDAEIEIVGENAAETLKVKAGETFTYLRYLGEGYTVMEYGGAEVQVNEGQLQDVTDIRNFTSEDDLWVRVSCLGGSQAWLLYDEVTKERGIGPSPMSDYGSASDLTESEVEEVRAMIATGMEAEEPSSE